MNGLAFLPRSNYILHSLICATRQSEAISFSRQAWKVHAVARFFDTAMAKFGRSFVVRDQKKFAADVIPKYFGKHIAYTSFTLRLARWG